MRSRRWRLAMAGAVTAIAVLLAVSSMSPLQARTQQSHVAASQPQPASSPATASAPLVAGAALAPPSSVHVHNLIPVSKDLANGRWRATVVIRVRDANENPVSGATVTGDFAGVTRTCVTNVSKGGCAVHRWQGDFVPRPKFVVTNIDAPGGYDPSANHDATGNDSDGTSIRVYQPLDSEPTHHIIAQDTTFTSRMILRPGDTVEFRNGARMSFAAGGYADWQGTPTATWSNDGATQNLNRNIKIFGDGDIRFEQGSKKSVIRFVEIDLQPTAELGRYPLHWHHAGEGSRGTFVVGVVVKNSTNRAFVPHASHGITFIDNIAKNTVRGGFWWDPPCVCDGAVNARFHTANNSNDIEVYRMLVDGVRPPPGAHGHAQGAYVLGAGSGNVLRNSVAMNVVGGKNSSGFHWPSSANLNAGGNVWVFKDNRAYNVVDGAFIWQNDPNDHVVTRFKAWNVSGAGVTHGAYLNKYRYLNLDVDSFEVHALGGWKAVGGRIDEVRVKGHNAPGRAIFRDVAITRVVVDNSRGQAAAALFFKNTGLSCSDITVESLFPGTSIRINGVRCNL